MFCSKCGKTLPMDGASCPSCGCPVGQSRFEGSPYTSAQAHILPGDDVHQAMSQSYTRTTYTSMGDAEPQGDVDARTTYRPAYGGDSMPEDMHRDMRAAVKPEAEQAPSDATEYPADEPPRDPVDEVIEEVTEDLQSTAVDTSKYRDQKIESAGQTGISSDVSELIQELESEPRRGSRRRRAVYEDYEDVATAGEGASASEDEQGEVFDDIDEEEFEELRHSSFGLKQLLKVLVKLLLLPVVVSISYEFNRFVGRHDNAVTRALSYPGMALQNFTTNEPDDSMIEVAIRALELVLPEREGDDRW